MKYYIYISQTKIDMLYGQIQTAHSETREASLGFDIKLLKGDLKDSRGIPDNQFTKLDKVLSSLNKLDLVGDIDSDKEYISATLDMKWGSYGGESEAPITFWGYSTFEYPFTGLVLALAGSKYHLLGEQRDGYAHSHSLTNAMTEWFLLNLGERHQEQIYLMNRHQRINTSDLDNYDVANGAWLAATQIEGQVCKYEFVAKVLHRSEWESGFRTSKTNKIMLATPLYVAML